MKNIFSNIRFTIYFDIGITFACLMLIIYSLIPNSFSILPMQFVQPFLGINRLKEIIEILHYILIGISISLILQSFIMLFEYNIQNIKSITIIKILFYKWLVLTINSAIPYAFNIQTPSIFIILSIIILLFFWYVKL